MVPLKNTASLQKQTSLILCTFSLALQKCKIINPRLLIKSAVDDFIGRLILNRFCYAEIVNLIIRFGKNSIN